MKQRRSDEFIKALYILIVACIAILFYFFLLKIQIFVSALGIIMNIIRPFIIGAVIAYLLIPVQNWLLKQFSKLFQLEKCEGKKADKRRKLCSGLSIFLSIVIFLFLLFELIMQILPQTMESVKSIIEMVPGVVAKLEAEVQKITSGNPQLSETIEYYANLIYEEANAELAASLNEKINFLVTGVSSGLLSAVSLLKDFLIGLIVAIYVLGSRKIFLRQAKLLVRAMFPKKEDLPEGKEQKADFIFREASIMNNYMNGFVKGKIIDSFIIGMICLVFCLIVRMPYAELVSVIVGVTNIIPFFGPFIGAIPTALIILMVDPMKCLVFIIFVVILQQLDGNVIGPYILGNATKLSSFWVLFAILLFGGLFGIPGMIMGVPVFGFIYQLIRELIYKKINLNTGEE